MIVRRVAAMLARVREAERLHRRWGFPWRQAWMVAGAMPRLEGGVKKTGAPDRARLARKYHGQKPSSMT